MGPNGGSTPSSEHNELPDTSFYTHPPGPQAPEPIPLGATGKENESDGCLFVTNGLSEAEHACI